MKVRQVTIIFPEEVPEDLLVLELATAMLPHDVPWVAKDETVNILSGKQAFPLFDQGIKTCASASFLKKVAEQMNRRDQT